MSNYTKEEQFDLIKYGMSGGYSLRYIDNQFEEVCLEAIKLNAKILEYVKEQTEELCLEAVRREGVSLKYVKEQTPQICLEAVKNYGLALKYVKEQTPEICLEAVKQDGMVLEYVKEQTEKICLEAVKESGHALKYVREQTPQICLEAVKGDSYALRYVKEQTPEICLEAVRKDGWTLLNQVKNRTLELYFYAYLHEYQLYNNRYVKEKVDKFISDECIIENKVFCDDAEGEINRNVFYFSKKPFREVKDYLLNGKNNNNEFMLYDTSEDELIKEIALSNNRLTIIDTGKINNTHRILANEIVDLASLKEGIKEPKEIPF